MAFSMFHMNLELPRIFVRVAAAQKSEPPWAPPIGSYAKHLRGRRCDRRSATGSNNANHII